MATIRYNIDIERVNNKSFAEQFNDMRQMRLSLAHVIIMTIIRKHGTITTATIQKESGMGSSLYKHLKRLENLGFFSRATILPPRERKRNRLGKGRPMQIWTCTDSPQATTGHCDTPDNGSNNKEGENRGTGMYTCEQSHSARGADTY